MGKYLNQFSIIKMVRQDYDYLCSQIGISSTSMHIRAKQVNKIWIIMSLRISRISLKVEALNWLSPPEPSPTFNISGLWFWKYLSINILLISRYLYWLYFCVYYSKWIVEHCTHQEVIYGHWYSVHIIYTTNTLCTP